MKQNKYDDPTFFEKYSGMQRSRKGLEGAGEWHALRALLPPMTGKRVLDLGCGFGWHCAYAIEQGAARAVGIDLSEKMLERARRLTEGQNVTYLRMPIEEIDFEEGAFELVVSSLALHYVEDFQAICQKVARALTAGGQFVLSVEHPIFTAAGAQDWHYDQDGARMHWPVDRYFEQGAREAVFLGEPVTKYHRTLTGYLGGLRAAGFALLDVCEPQPSPDLLAAMPDELRRPMMLIIKAEKPAG